MNLPIQLIDFAVANATRHTTPEDVAAALLSALCKIRSAVGDAEGFASQCALDDGIRARLLLERLRAPDGEAYIFQSCPLPPPSASRTRRIAATMVDDVLEVILAGRGPIPIGLLAGGMVHHLLGHLIDQLQGLPDAEELLAAIRISDTPQATVTMAEGSTVVRIH